MRREAGATPAGAGAAAEKLTAKLRRWFDGTAAFTASAAVLFVVGSLFLLAAVQSPSMLQWTGTAVHAVEDGGIAYYSFHGVQYTLDVSSPGLGSSTVYIDPSDPSNAMFSNPVIRLAELGSVGGPYAASALLLAFGLTRSARRRRRRLRNPETSFGKGLDQNALARLRERQRDQPGDRRD
jgi:hypothetical protein